MINRSGLVAKTALFGGIEITTFVSPEDLEKDHSNELGSLAELITPLPIPDPATTDIAASAAATKSKNEDPNPRPTRRRVSTKMDKGQAVPQYSNTPSRSVTPAQNTFHPEFNYGPGDDQSHCTPAGEMDPFMSGLQQYASQPVTSPTTVSPSLQTPNEIVNSPTSSRPLEQVTPNTVSPQNVAPAPPPQHVAPEPSPQQAAPAPSSPTNLPTPAATAAAAPSAVLSAPSSPANPPTLPTPAAAAAPPAANPTQPIFTATPFSIAPKKKQPRQRTTAPKKRKITPPEGSATTSTIPDTTPKKVRIGNAGPLLHLLSEEELAQFRKKCRRGTNWTPSHVSLCNFLNYLGRPLSNKDALKMIAEAKATDAAQSAATSEHTQIGPSPINSSQVPIASPQVTMTSSCVSMASSHVPMDSPHVPMDSPHVPMDSPHVPMDSPHVPMDSPHVPMDSPHVPMDSPHVPMDSPHIPMDSPHVPMDSPHVPMDSPHVPMDSPQVEIDSPQVTGAHVHDTSLHGVLSPQNSGYSTSPAPDMSSILPSNSPPPQVSQMQYYPPIHTHTAYPQHRSAQYQPPEQGFQRPETIFVQHQYPTAPAAPVPQTPSETVSATIQEWQDSADEELHHKSPYQYRQ